MVPVALKAIATYFKHERHGEAWVKSEKNMDILAPVKNTSYRDDYAWNHGQQLSSLHPSLAMSLKHDGPVARRTARQSMSNQMLFQGTTKSTLQIPGYKGHIPMNRRVQRKEEHCSGEHQKRMDLNLTLTYPVLDRIPGYSGMVCTAYNARYPDTYWLCFFYHCNFTREPLAIM
jgi:hypothetical protein